jgi:predicted MFS family arabinose efflux permease
VVAAARTSDATTTIALRGWLVACSVYLLAVLHRTSLGVAGLLAAERFHITSAQLSVFVLVQLGLYAAGQIPAGLLVDRFGPRRMLLTAAVAMTLAQALFAVAPGYGVALLARGVLGIGDAMTFVSVLRFAATRLPARRYPLIVALTGTFGILGNMVATFPLAVALRDLGWVPSFAGLAVLSALTFVLTRFLLPGAPPRRFTGGVSAWRAVRVRVTRSVRAAWAVPGTRVGFWTHFTGTSATTAFGVLWGQPYLVTTTGMTPETASLVLLLTVAVSAVGGPSLGALLTRRPAVRVPVALGVGTVTVVGWLVVLAAATPAAPLVVVVVCLTALGAPASMIGFSLARDYNEGTAVGTATGVVNAAGFLATVVIALGIGLVLSLLGGQTPAHFRVAMLVLVAVELVGLVQLIRWWRRARAYLLVRQARGDVLPFRLRRHRWLDFPPA